MPEGLTFLLGGARSGKSDIATRLACSWSGPVTFVATAQRDDDAAFTNRIARHRAERPSGWDTVEEPRALAEALRRIDLEHLVVVDCLAVWVSNLMVDGLTETASSPLVDELTAAIDARTTPTIVVSNEVGLGVHPASTLGRDYRDVLGRVNRGVAARADRAHFVVAGHLLSLTAPQDIFR